MEGFSFLLFFSSALFLLLRSSAVVDTITVNQTIRDGDTIVSAGEMFELGFFSPGNSKNRYLGIWYKKISNDTVVWVANRDTPLTNTSGVFRIDGMGTLLLLSGGNTVVWSANSSIPVRIINPVAQLLDTGNLVVRDESSTDQGNHIWQSFDYPGDTLLPGMKAGKDLVTGIDRQLTSWKSLDDPSPGQYVFYIDTNGFPQMFVKQGSVLYARIGPWNGLRFNGRVSETPNPIYTYEFVFNQKEIYYKFELINSSLVSKLYLDPAGRAFRLNWINRAQDWLPYLTRTSDICARYGLCGPYGVCSMNNTPACSCMGGFEPRVPEEWAVADWSSGCQRKKPLDCGNSDSFRKISGVKFPDTQRSWYNISMSLGECEMACKKNCSCSAYANLDIRKGGSGCLIWNDDLMDIRESDESQDLYVRMSASELNGLHVKTFGYNRKKKILKVTLPTSAGFGMVALILAVYAWSTKKRSQVKRQGNRVQSSDENYTDERQNEDAELLSFGFLKIAKATNNFSINSLIGEGGFGPVYKGILEGREIAVKRLSKTSKQGLDELKNEVGCIAKLQHRNLVKLLGYCIHGDENMLIYEYMPNKSLDLFLFDESRSSMLDWPRRFQIIQGIARGLLYLHQDSRLRIVHRDLKAGNILLDFDMNPKISDFGLARMFRGHESEANTKKVVGTLGYISPEYAVNGLFSVKSDVFSFGVLVLEIVSGKRNRIFSHEERSDNLLGHAWRLFKERKSHELVSAQTHNSFVDYEVLRCIHIGLLCVQHHAEDRPTMSSVVVMLGSDVMLPPPKQPAFVSEESLSELNSCLPMLQPASVNEITITSLDAR